MKYNMLYLKAHSVLPSRYFPSRLKNQSVNVVQRRSCCSEIHTKHINVFCEKNLEFFNVEVKSVMGGGGGGGTDVFWEFGLINNTIQTIWKEGTKIVA
jgi:hypothetical protein